MPASAIRRRMFAAVVIAVAIPLALTSCSVVENLQSAGETLQRQVGEALGGEGESVSDEGDTGIYDLVAGDCINDSQVDPTATAVASLDSADCEEPHDSEVIGLPRLDGILYPGDDEVAMQSDDACMNAFESWTGGEYDEITDLEYTFYVPTEAGWLTGDSSVLCTVFADGQISGSTKGAGTAGADYSIGEMITLPDWTVSDDGNTAVDTLTMGQCLNDLKVAIDVTLDEVRSVNAVDCAMPHDSEVLGLASISGEAYFADDDDSYFEAIDAACVPLFDAWVGAAYDDVPDLDYGFYPFPTIKSRLDVYPGVCTIYRIDEAQIVGTTNGAGAAGA